jgi:hypothetical protein
MHITTCSDFEIKFKDYLNFLKSNNHSLFNLLISNKDFKVNDIDIFRKEFNFFFKYWLIKYFKYKYSFESEYIDNFVSMYKTTGEKFDELFANYNFYKKINSAIDELYIYDISNNENIKYKEIIVNKPLLGGPTGS